jgi:YHS domain-containing protein
MVTAQSGPPSAKPEIPLLGLDPVLLLQGKEVQGDLNISVTRRGYKYLFANAENKARFEQSPERYEIQFGGICARDGSGGPVREAEIYFVHQDRLYVFHSFECQKEFAAAPENYFESAASAPKINASPEALKKGAALIEKAVAAMGGAAAIDSLTSYQEVGTTAEMMGGPDGIKVREVKNSTTLVFPGQIRKEQTTNAPRPTLVIGTKDAFGVFQNRAMSMPPAEREKLERQVKLKLLSILRARNGAGFKASLAEPQKLGGTTLEQVTVEFDGLPLTLGIEPTLGRIQRLAYRGRGPNYNFGEIAQVFSDFRQIEGVLLPFKISGTFNGQPEPTQSSVIESIKLNAQIDPALFERPKPPIRQ